MAAYDDRGGERPRGWLHDWLPIIVVAAACFVVVAFNVHA